MNERVLIRGKALTCSLGHEMDAIISKIRQKTYDSNDVWLRLANSECQRPYYRIASHTIQNECGQEAYFYHILFDTIEKAIKDACLTPDELSRMAVFLGSTSLDIPIYEAYYENSDDGRSNIFSLVSSGYGNIALNIAKRFNIKGPCYTFVTACTSSANAMIYAASMIQTRAIERALVIGYDLFNKTGLYGFESLKLISPTSYKPFSKNRDGIIMGEGCGAIVLDTTTNAPNDFYYCGGATCCDTFNITTHHADGNAIAHVIRQALADAGMTPSDITGVKAHATGSYQNDKSECNGIKSVFGSRIPPVTGIKPFIGHTVGASGVIEAILITESVKQGFFPATLGFDEPDEELGIMPLTENHPVTTGSFVLNYFGFGGNCSCIVVSNNVSNEISNQ